MTIETSLAALRALTLDVDGVLTDGRIAYTSGGEELKSFHVRDGAAIKLLLRAGIHIAVITGRQSDMVARRAAELGIAHVYQGNEEKNAAFEHFLAQVGVDAAHAGHVGDDTADLSLFDVAGVGIAVADAHPAVIARADWVTAAGGGSGVMQEISQRILQAQDAWPY